MSPAKFRSFRLPQSREHFSRDMPARTEHIKVELRVDFEKKRIDGSCTLTVVPVAGPLASLDLDACDLEVKGVASGSSACDYDHDMKTLSIRFPTPVTGRTEVRIEYGATPDKGVHFTGPDEAHPEREVQAWTHNEAEFARYWFPCFDDPRDKSSSEMIVTVPKGFRVVSNGVLLSEKDAGDEVTFHWKEELKHSTYLKSFVAGKFGEAKQESEGVQLSYYYPESKREDVHRYFGETPDMIRLFNELTGVKYPYKKYAQTTVEEFIFGGMENFNATTLAMNYYPTQESEEDFATSYATPNVTAAKLVAHELAHQWFGDLVTCSDWSHAWLNEGFATYLQVLFVERTRGVDEMRVDMAGRAKDYFEEDAESYRRPIVSNDYFFPDDMFDETLYKKGAWMIHKLRFVLGDPAFFSGISDYLKEHALSTADTHDFRRSMERASGKSLEEFFDQSFLRAGYPEFEVTYQWDEPGKAASLRVRQTQDPAYSVNPFKVPCEVAFYVQGRRILKRISISERDQTFTFVLDSMPSMVEFDPAHWLLKKLKFDLPVGMLTSQLASSEDASSRADAARSLGEMKAAQAIERLSAAARGDMFWHVRAESFAALGTIGTPEALKAILESEVPTDRRARRGMAKALGSFKQPEAKLMLSKMLGGDVSPYVRCEAALSLAKSDPAGAYPLLREAMKSHSPNETLAEACLEAMGKLEEPEVEKLVLQYLRYGNPMRARIGAMKAIKSKGKATDEQVGILKGILLGDPEFRVRLYLVDTLVPALKDPKFNDALEVASVKERDPRVKRKAMEALRNIRD